MVKVASSQLPSFGSISKNLDAYTDCLDMSIPDIKIIKVVDLLTPHKIWWYYYIHYIQCRIDLCENMQISSMNVWIKNKRLQIKSKIYFCFYTQIIFKQCNYITLQILSKKIFFTVSLGYQKLQAQSSPLQAKSKQLWYMYYVCM